MNIWHDMDPRRITTERFDAVVEISRGQQSKYELDKETGLIRLDRVLYTSTHYPQNYGFIPRTYAGDDDPLDVLILCSQPLVPMTIVTCTPIGAVRMLDGGELDEKLLPLRQMIQLILRMHRLMKSRNMCYKKFVTFSKCIKHLKVKKQSYIIFKAVIKLLIY